MFHHKISGLSSVTVFFLACIKLTSVSSQETDSSGWVSISCSHKRPWISGQLVTCSCDSYGGSSSPQEMVLKTRMHGTVRGYSPLPLNVTARKDIHGTKVVCIALFRGEETVIQAIYTIEVLFRHTSELNIIVDGATYYQGDTYHAADGVNTTFYCFTGRSNPPSEIVWQHSRLGKAVEMEAPLGDSLTSRSLSVVVTNQEQVQLKCTVVNSQFGLSRSKRITLKPQAVTKPSTSSAPTVDASLFLWGIGGIVCGTIATYLVVEGVKLIQKTRRQKPHEISTMSRRQLHKLSKRMLNETSSSSLPSMILSRSNNARRKPKADRRPHRKRQRRRRPIREMQYDSRGRSRQRRRHRGCHRRRRRHRSPPPTSSSPSAESLNYGYYWKDYEEDGQ